MGDVLIVAGAPVTERMKSWTAVLAAGGDVALAAQTAGREFGLEQVPARRRTACIAAEEVATDLAEARVGHAERGVSEFKFKIREGAR